MRRSPAIALLVVLLVLPVALIAQQANQTVTPPTRDPQAVSVLQQAFAALGNKLPADSVATGTVTIVEGSSKDDGTIRIATRSHDQSVEDITLPNDHRVVVYSRLAATETRGGKTKTASLELSLSSQTPDFPLPLVEWALNSPDASATYVGLESVNGESLHHIRIWNALASKPALQSVSEFSIRDIWIDPVKFLPREISYFRREGGGYAPRFQVEVFFSDYHEVSGIFYPFLIQKNFNGTPWTTITVSSVKLNTGLTDTDFQLPTGGAL
jgi:outer membrane lipoprotein-sorting protein